MSKYDLEKIRKKMASQKNDFSDPDEFRPPRVQQGDSYTYRFYVLPPLQKGDTCKGGKASKSMEEVFVRNGNHFHNKNLQTCPRVTSGEDGECPVCNYGFDLLEDIDRSNKELRSEIAKKFLSRERYMINAFFPKDNVNPEELQNKVRWISVGKTIYDKFEACIMAEDGGDEADPQPFGVFFDEEEAYLFQMEVTSKGNYNNYDDSKFLTSLGKHPIVKDKDGKPVDDAIQAVLDSRIDLFSKIDDVDYDALGDMLKSLTSEQSGSGFDEDETKSTATAATGVEGEMPVDEKEEVKEEKEEEAEEEEKAEAEEEETEEETEAEEKAEDDSKDKGDEGDDEVDALIAELQG